MIPGTDHRYQTAVTATVTSTAGSATLAANDLETALEIIKASDEQSSGVSITDRVEELIRFAVSPAYLALRETLGLAITR